MRHVRVAKMNESEPSMKFRNGSDDVKSVLFKRRVISSAGVWGLAGRPPSNWVEPMSQSKPFALSKLAVWEAFKKVRASRGVAGVNGQLIEDFGQNLSGNLYKLWNRLASGSYMPLAVRRVEIPKATGGTRPLGIPTVADLHLAKWITHKRVRGSLAKAYDWLRRIRRTWPRLFAHWDLDYQS